MREELRSELLTHLVRDYGFKRQGDYLRRGKCPSCGKQELWTSEKEPWVIRCGRENRCGWQGHSKELYPDAFGRLNERYPATTEAPNATADAYMAFVRHLTITGVRDWYRQGHFRHQHGNRTTATVVFDVGPTAWMERLIEPVTITDEAGKTEVRKANFVGSHKGLWWAPPGLEIADGEDLWLVEGCIDAISLHLHGIKAVATLSCGNYPERALADLLEKGVRPALIWALDGDAVGRRGIAKHVKTARAAGYTCAGAIIPQTGRSKTDWNDAHAAGDLTDQDIKRYRYHGDLLLAPSALEKGLLVWRRHRSVSFSIEFGTRTWWWDLPQAPFAATIETLVKEGEIGTEEEIRWEAARQTAVVAEIANVSFQFLYFQKSELTDESWYYVRIRFPHQKYEIKNTFTGAQVATASEFKKRLLAIAPGALFTGGTWQLNWIIEHHLDKIRVVDTVDFIGYSKQHKAYVFNDIAVSHGKVYEINDEDFFEIGSTSVKSLNSSLHLHIGDEKEYRKDWLSLVYTAFGSRGIVASAFFLGSLFAEQIREIHKSFPFLEIVGEAGSGKSTLIEFLWKLVGRTDYEGFDPNKSTLAARSRIMTQVSNLPISMIESDRGDDFIKQKQFDWDELKTAYNGRASRARAVANGGNDTKEPPFRGSILISQNAPVNASDAIMQRIIHMSFTTAGHTTAGKAAADTLASLPVEEVSHFLIAAVTRETSVLRIVASQSAVHEAALLQRQTIRSVRIAKNHGQLMALVEALADLTRMPPSWLQETLQVIAVAAEQRQAAIASDHQLVEEFWDTVEFIGVDKINHVWPGSDIIAVNLNHVLSIASKHGLSMPPMVDLKRHLKGSRSRPFLDVKTVRSCQPDYNTIKCWCFKNLAGGRNENDSVPLRLLRRLVATVPGCWIPSHPGGLEYGQDVRLFRYAGRLHGILAAPPCTHLARSGAPHWQRKGEAALLDALAVVDACVRIVVAHSPTWWALENPIGRLKDCRSWGSGSRDHNPRVYAEAVAKSDLAGMAWARGHWYCGEHGK